MTEDRSDRIEGKASDTQGPQGASGADRANAAPAGSANAPTGQQADRQREDLAAYIRNEKRTFAEKPLCDADLLALAALAYAEFERYPQIAQDCPAVRDLPRYGTLWSLAEHDCNAHGMYGVLEALTGSPRFGDLRIEGFRCIVSEERQIQFGALHVTLPTDDVAVVFRGTDMKYVGWLEDFNMLCLPAMAGQTEALRYLRETAAALPDRPLYVCGHSKGGAYAEYATVFADPEIQERVQRAVSFDGPALYKLGGSLCPDLARYDETVEEAYDNLRAPLTRYITPAMIGLMMERTDADTGRFPYTQSLNPNMNHNVCSFRIVDGEFPLRTPAQKEIDAGFKFSRWAETLTIEERQTMPGFLVDSFKRAGIPIDLSDDPRDIVRALRHNYRFQTKDVRAVVRSAIRKYLRA